MNVDKISVQTTSFKSRFIPSQTLEQAFDRAAKENDRFFLKAMNTIMNDGKNDVVELTQRAPKYIDLLVNNKLVEEGNTYLNFYTHTSAEIIKHYAEKISKECMTETQYKNLSQQEKKLISENVDLIRMFSENFENSNNYIENVQQALNNIKKQLDNNTKQELQNLKSIIFGN